MDLTAILGYTACGITSLTFLPQLIKTWKERSAKDVSLLMFIIAVINETLWIGYGILRKDPVIIVTNLILISMALLMISLKLKYSRTSRDA